MRCQRPLGSFTHAAGNPNLVTHTDARDTEYAIDRLDVAFDLCANLIGLDRNLTHCQCAGKSAEQSTADGGNDVIEGGRNLFVRLDAVEVLNGSMNPESDWRIKRFDVGVTDGPLDSLDADTARVDGISHGSLLRTGRYHSLESEAAEKETARFVVERSGLVQINPGSDLLSHTPAHAVPSAVAGLTSVFGMGTGVTLPL